LFHFDLNFNCLFAPVKEL